MWLLRARARPVARTPSPGWNGRRRAQASRSTDGTLAPRELATRKLLADGKANKEIANELDISERTVKTHLAHLFEKLVVTSRTEAIKEATRRGLVRLD